MFLAYGARRAVAGGFLTWRAIDAMPFLPLLAALTQMYIQGVSTRKVQAISEELCGHSFSASAISEFNKNSEKVRECAVIRSPAVLVAIGIDWEGWRQVLGVEMAQERKVQELERVSGWFERRGTAKAGKIPGMVATILPALFTVGFIILTILGVVAGSHQ
jgi:mutator family transposase